MKNRLQALLVAVSLLTFAVQLSACSVVDTSSITAAL